MGVWRRSLFLVTPLPFTRIPLLVLSNVILMYMLHECIHITTIPPCTFLPFTYHHRLETQARCLRYRRRFRLNLRAHDEELVLIDENTGPFFSAS